MQDVPKIVLKRLQETAAAGAHPDADILTAFAEQSLVESERARVMEHLACCVACREVVVLALPATESGAVTTSGGPIHSAWLSWPVLRWSVVVTGIVALASVGILHYRLRQKSDTFVSNLTARNQTSATVEQPLSQSPSSSEPPELLPQTKKEKQAEMRKKAPSNRVDNLDADKLARPLNPILPPARAMHGAASGSWAGGSSGFGSNVAVVPKTTFSSTRETPALARNLKNATPAEAAKLEPSLSGGQAAGVPSTSQSAEVVQSEAAVITTAQVASGISAPTISPPNIALQTAPAFMQLASPRWSISVDGALQRSFDAGNTWVNVNPELAASRSKVESTSENMYEYEKKNKKVEARRNPILVFRAVATLGTEVWAGGSAAMLYHSVDSGTHWARVLPSSSGAMLTGDITGIEFYDVQHGRVTTSAGEIWITADDGRTWRGQ
jgi:hypothetical protein